MDLSKVDLQLQLALTLPAEERQKSAELTAGYDQELNVWELIINYTGDLSSVADKYDLSVTLLFSFYAVVVIREEDIPSFSEEEQILYIEKPKNLDFEDTQGIRSSCISAVRRPPLSLYGAGAIIAIIDSGIDYAHPDFRKEDGTTKILAIWDQTQEGNPPAGYFLGTEYSEDLVNEALATADRREALQILPETDRSGHGTHVAGIATMIAPEAELIIVKLGQITKQGFPKTSELMLAVNYCLQQAAALNRPIAVNLSFGNNYGGHNGDSVVEDYLDKVSTVGRNTIVVGTGNDGDAGRHTRGQLQKAVVERQEFILSPGERSLNLQVWSDPVDTYSLTLITPNGETTTPFGYPLDVLQNRLLRSGVLVNILSGPPTPYRTGKEIYLSLIPLNDTLPAGPWAVELRPTVVTSGRYDMWLPVAGSTNTNVYFLRAVTETTMTVPSTASRVISVGAYDAFIDAIPSFSGRGYTRSGAVKPDLVAPGVDVYAASPGGGYTLRTGTSMAAPFVAGAAALLMEWGVVDGNDPFLYGEKVKAYLISGARQLPGLESPNPLTGWGALCVRDSLPD